MAEHNNNIIKKYYHSQLYQLTLQSDHSHNFDGAKVIQPVRNFSVRKQIEGNHSELTEDSSNSLCDVSNCILPMLSRLQ